MVLDASKLSKLSKEIQKELISEYEYWLDYSSNQMQKVEYYGTLDPGSDQYCPFTDDVAEELNKSLEQDFHRRVKENLGIDTESLVVESTLDRHIALRTLKDWTL